MSGSGKAPRKQTSLAERLEPYWLIAPALLFVGVFAVWPLIQTVWLSTYDYALTGSSRTFVGLQNYSQLLADDIFWRSLTNNVLILVASVVLQVGGGLAIAALIDRGIHRGKTFFATIVFAPVVMSAIAVGVLWRLVYNPVNGLVPAIAETVGVDPPREGVLGEPSLVVLAIIIVAAWQYTGFIAIILYAGMRTVDKHLYEAATLDGASGIQAFFNITIPSIRNVLVAATLLTMIGAFKVFDVVYVLTRGGPANASQVLGTYVFYNGFTIGQAGYANAIAVVLMLFAVALGLLQLRFTRQVGS